MSRPARPSDLYRLPDLQSAPPLGREDDPEEPAPPTGKRHSRRPLAVLAAGALVALVVAAVAVRPGPPPETQGTAVMPPPPASPVVEQTRMALALHGAETDAVRTVAAHDDRFDSASLLTASVLLRDDADHVARHLQQSRDLPGASQELASYAWDDGHDLLVRRLRHGQALTGDLAVLEAVHSRASTPAQASPGQLSRLGELGRRGASHSSARWARALSAALQPAPPAPDMPRSFLAAERARAAALQAWHNHAMIMRQPAGVQRLRSQLISLEPAAVGELRAHPYLGRHISELLPPGWPPLSAPAP